MNILRAALTTLLVGALLFPSSVFAQLSASETGEAVVLATVNIHHAKIVSQSKRAFRIAFDLTNREGVQPEVKYGITLTQSHPTGQMIVDEKVYEEVLTLGVGREVHKEVDYDAPEQLSGTYDLWVSSRSTGGVPFGSMFVGKVTFYPSTLGIVSIDPVSCFLTVEGEVEGVHYAPLQGVDISGEETINAHCAVTNTTDGVVTLAPLFSTYERSIYGAIVSSIPSEAVSASLFPNERKIVSFVLPKAKDRGVYDVTLVLRGSDEIVSNAVKFRYILQGRSVTIRNIIWDKENYRKGDVILAALSWAPSPDIFPDSRGEGTLFGSPTVEVRVTDEHGVSCGAPATKELVSGTPLVHLPIVATKTCTRPELHAIINEKTYGVLATGHFRTLIDGESSGDMSIPPPPVESSGVLIMIVIFVLVLFALFIVGFFMRKKNAADEPALPMGGVMLLALMIGVGACSTVPKVHADTWHDTQDTVYTGSLDKDSYLVGESILGTGSVERWSSYNPVRADFMVNVNGVTVNGRTNQTLGGGVGLSQALFLGSLPVFGAPAFQPVNAPSTAGAYHLSFGGSVFSINPALLLYIFHNIPFTITPPTSLPPAPVVTITPHPGVSVPAGSVGSISWSATNKPALCSIERDGVLITTGQPAFGTQDLGILTGNTALIVTCANSGGSTSASATFVVAASPPQLSVVPKSLDFGTVTMGEIKRSTAMDPSFITIQNIGGGTLHITGITPSAPFACVAGCTGVLAGGASQVATIRMTAPTVYGSPSEIITVNSDTGTQSVNVFGKIIPTITIKPGPLDFGSVVLKKFADKPLTIINNSTSLTIPAGSIRVAPPFSCLNSCAYPAISPGGSEMIMIRFTPTVVGAQSGVAALSTLLADNTGVLKGIGLPLTFTAQER